MSTLKMFIASSLSIVGVILTCHGVQADTIELLAIGGVLFGIAEVVRK